MKQSIWSEAGFVATLEVPVEKVSLLSKYYVRYLKQAIDSMHDEAPDEIDDALWDLDFINFLLSEIPDARRLSDDPDADYEHTWWYGRCPERFSRKSIVDTAI